MHFLTPMGLLLGLLAAPLVALYFLRLRRRKVLVSSLLPWHAAKRSEQLASPFQRFRRNLLLLLQLALLLLLVLAAARPFVPSSQLASRSVVLVVDSSASMGATDGAPRRIDQALAEARALIDGLDVGDEALIIEAGAETKVVAPFTADRGLLRAALSTIDARESGATLEEGLRLAVSLARTRPDVEVVLLTDGGPGDLSAVPLGAVPVRAIRVGRSRDNAGVISLDLRRSPVSDQEQQLFVTVKNFGDTDQRGSVVVRLDGGSLVWR
jgi:Ca-activated chloride channel family protein